MNNKKKPNEKPNKNHIALFECGTTNGWWTTSHRSSSLFFLVLLSVCMCGCAEACILNWIASFFFVADGCVGTLRGRMVFLLLLRIASFFLHCSH